MPVATVRDLRNRRQFRTSGFRGSSIDAAKERLAPQEALEVVQEERDQPVVFIDSARRRRAA